MNRLLQKANRQLRVSDDARADELIKSGYVELNPDTGKPLKAADPEKDIKKENAALKKENKALQEQVAALTEKLGTAEKNQ
jgi:hypothetical protein|uniref:Uncharacterized protein n=1 Tax=Siphoviridae sp. ctHNe8 TaxID=2827827 RepID=A0A8S5S8D4_9CAUD|nr:MAG TPA: hypothetical protein [Siphoviridae sp. ctHNe8]DAW20197.1 MAG TPA: hypothetical protein [Caudoviricetes sp.]